MVLSMRYWPVNLNNTAKFFVVVGMTMGLCAQSHAQNGIDSGENAAEEFENFKKAIYKEFDDFRSKCNEDYAAFLKNPWKTFEINEPKPLPVDDDVKPVVCPIGDTEPPVLRPVTIDVVVPAPKPVPRPEPVSPIKENILEDMSRTTFRVFGTKMTVRESNVKSLRLGGVRESDISRAWNEMSSDGFADNLVRDCLELRRSKNLCDWAYLAMLKAMAESVCGQGTNEAVLLMAYVYCQSGYKMRLARDNSNRLYMLFASRHVIFNRCYFNIDGEQYYPYGDAPESLYICECAFPKEQSLSLIVSESPRLDLSATQTAQRRSRKYPDLTVSVKVNKNLIDFFDSYPASKIGDDVMTRWAMLANTPMSNDVKQQLYPQLRRAIEGCNQLAAVNKLLDFVQTGFEYEYDDKVWGCDRAFFAEETLHYPYSDCEDHSILFTRLVRDLLGLRCILVYYPGHLAAAVEFTEGKVSGDYIQLYGKRFIITDATYIGAPAGLTMEGMDNQKAKVILLSNIK